MSRNRIVAALALFSTAVLGCSEAGGGISAPDEARMSTTRVVVSCPQTLPEGSNGPCSATGYDANNQPTTGTVTWSSTDATKVTVSSSGVATGVATGSADVRAVISGVIGSGTVVVIPPEDQ